MTVAQISSGKCAPRQESGHSTGSALRMVISSAGRSSAWASAWRAETAASGIAVMDGLAVGASVGIKTVGVGPDSTGVGVGMGMVGAGSVSIAALHPNRMDAAAASARTPLNRCILFTKLSEEKMLLIMSLSSPGIFGAVRLSYYLFPGENFVLARVGWERPEAIRSTDLMVSLLPGK
jgi:hypothetical protein